MPEVQGIPGTSDAEASVLLQEKQYEGFPSGFRTNFIDDERLETFTSILAEGVTETDDGSLTDITRSVSRPAGSEFTEADEINWVIDRVVSSFVTPERSVALPGVALNRELIKAVAVAYKRDTDTPSGTIKPADFATNDDIAIEFVTPETYSEIGTGTAFNYIRTGLTDDSTVEVIGTNGIDGGGTAAFTLNARDWLFYTGDVLDPLDDARLTKYQWTQVDGDTNLGPSPDLLGRSVSSLHMQLIPAVLAKEDVRLQAKVYDAGAAQEAEPIPVAFRLTDGANVQALQD